MRQSIIYSLVAFAILATVLWSIEALWPEQRKQPKWRSGSFSDLLYLLVDVGLRRITGPIVVVLVVILFIGHVHRSSIAALQPLWLQTVEALVGGELLGYWLHRAFHLVPWLWPFHAIHHSPPMLDWVAASRVHPVDSLVHKVLTILPMFLLGFSPGVLAAYAPFLTLYPIVLHANVRWGFGPFRWVIASPAWHRWHHSSEADALDKNFAGLFPWVDLLFGSAYFPDRAPVAFGLDHEAEPRGMWAQMVYPFRRRRLATRPAIAM